MAKRYHDEVQRLIATFNEPGHRRASAELIRSLIEKIVFTPDEDRSALALDLYGDLAGILQISARHSAAHSAASVGPSLAARTEFQQVKMSADAAEEGARNVIGTADVGSAGWGGRIRTCECRHQKPVPYHLATPQHVRRAGLIAGEPRRERA
jgi:hypothetical protein